MELGIVEGFFGPLWRWNERRALVDTLAPHGYSRYVYAPKGDGWLRRQWAQPLPSDHAHELGQFASHCLRRDVRLGVGLSPFELYRNFDGQARRQLADKLSALNDLGITELAILFDDMQAGSPDLADRQLEIMAWIGAHSGFRHLMFCPSYYSDDPVLDRVFGQRPERYLETLGAGLDPAIEVFWTGEEVCSREFSMGHLHRIGEQLQRPPLLWDNYPVNDGERMSAHLHLRGFTGRSAANEPLLSGHLINPALQPTLTTIPALTLAYAYQRGDGYAYGEAFYDACLELMGQPLADMLQADLLKLQDAGLNRLSEDSKRALAARYSQVSHPAAREICRWLEGGYAMSSEMVQTQ